MTHRGARREVQQLTGMSLRQAGISAKHLRGDRAQQRISLTPRYFLAVGAELAANDLDYAIGPKSVRSPTPTIRSPRFIPAASAGPPAKSKQLTRTVSPPQLEDLQRAGVEPNAVT